MKKIVVSFSIAFITSLFAAGCSGADSTSDPTPATSIPTDSVATPPSTPTKATGEAHLALATDLPAGAAAGRGTLLGTVLASSDSQSGAGVYVWASFKNDVGVTTYGFDADGRVVTELTAKRGASASEIVLTAPSSGTLRLAKDGTVIESTFRTANPAALAAMEADIRASGVDQAYSTWFTWARLAVFCAVAGANAGVNVAADFACAEAAVELMCD